MKRLSIIISLLCALGFSIGAQNMSPLMSNAINICQNLSGAIGSSNTSRLRDANNSLKAADIVNFGDLWLVKGKDLNVNGHFIFDEDFIDDLIKDGKVLSFSSKYAKKRSVRNYSDKTGKVKLTTKALKAGQSCTWRTSDRKNAEYALVAEPGGLFTMTIRDKSGKVLYAETVNNKAGSNIRKAKIQLPANSTIIFLEIKNCGKKDASFALLCG